MRLTRIGTAAAFLLSVTAHASMAQSGRPSVPTASIVGWVVGVDGQPIAGVQALVQDLAREAVSDQEGRFELAKLPAGLHVVRVRRLGFAGQDTAVALIAEEQRIIRFVLQRLSQLDTVAVRATNIIPSFEDHRKMGLGHFITGEQLEKQQHRRFRDIIADVPGIRIRTGVSGRAWLYSSRRPVTSINSRGTGKSHLDDMDVRSGAPEGLCYAQVYVDDVLMYGAREREPLFDLNNLVTDQIEAVEYYAGPSRTPGRYSRLNSTCGVLVIHTRRARK